MLIRIAIYGLITCIAMGAINLAVWNFAEQYDWQGIPVYCAFAVFILQTAMLGAFIGSRVNRQPIWLLFFGWTLVAVNLVLMLINFESFSWQLAFQSAFVFAFLTAQMGLVVFWALLDSTDWRLRIPVGSALLITSSYPFWIPVGGRNRWLETMTGYLVAVALSCIVLRLWRFRIDTQESWIAEARAGRIDQFGIRHLFIWTTMVAILFGIGRFIPWQLVYSLILDQVFVVSIARALLMSMIIVATAWTVLGEKPNAWIRVIAFVGVLVSIGFGLAFVDLNNNRARIAGWQLNWEASSQIWLVWTVLSGLFLAGLMLAIRMSGRQLARIKRVNKPV